MLKWRLWLDFHQLSVYRVWNFPKLEISGALVQSHTCSLSLSLSLSPAFSLSGTFSHMHARTREHGCSWHLWRYGMKKPVKEKERGRGSGWWRHEKDCLHVLVSTMNGTIQKVKLFCKIITLSNFYSIRLYFHNKHFWIFHTSQVE